MVRAADLHVPSQYTTIQAAIVAAAPGDRVLVHPGTYYEAIFNAKAIEIIGIGGAAATVIDATGKGTSAVTFLDAVSPATLLQGFTITGGTGQIVGGNTAGGGLRITGSACTVRDCVITSNSVGPGSADRGGGIFVGSGPSLGNAPQIVGCVIAGNQASSLGGGIFATGHPSTGWPIVRDCTIVQNQAAYGGGCYGAGDFIDCVIEGNVATGYGGGAYSVHSLKGSLLRGNTAASFGGGYYDYQVYGVKLADCTLIENSAYVGGGAYLASDSPTLFAGPEAVLSGCVFARNSAAFTDGLALSFTYFIPPQSTITNCTFDKNRYSGAGSIEIRNCIIRGVPVSSPGAASYSNIEGGAVGPGNIDADPLWVDPDDGNYRLQGCSPCIDAGDPASATDADGTQADMGAVPFAAWTDFGGGVPGTSGASVLTGIGLLIANDPAGFTLTNTPPSTPVFLVLGTATSGSPFKGGTFWPTKDAIVTGLMTDPSGTFALSSPWPALLPCGFTLCVQAWWPDAGSESGWAGSNGLFGVSR
jgi:hypothetical protein